MNFNTLILSIDKRQIATLALNRPDVYNVLSLEMIRALLQVVVDLNKHPDVRAIKLAGAGKFFVPV